MKNYIWDFDGMLFDSYPHITSAFLKALDAFGKNADYDEAKALLEITYADAFEHYSVTEAEKAAFREYEHDYALRPIAVPFENTVETLKTLFDGGKRHFLYTHRGRESSRHYLREYGLEKLFTGFVDSSMNFPPKPASDAIEWLCSEYGLDKSETVMIGDREIDVLSGKRAGVFACLFSKNKKPQSCADFIVDDISQVCGLIEYKIRPAELSQAPCAEKIYNEVFDVLEKGENFPNWTRGVYPTLQTAQSAAEKGSLYLLEEGGEITACAVFNKEQLDCYSDIKWEYPASANEALVIHTLCVSPRSAGKGSGRRMVKYACELAKRQGCKAIRLDTYFGNAPAASLYEGLGFRYAGEGETLFMGLIPEKLKFYECKINQDNQNGGY